MNSAFSLNSPKDTSLAQLLVKTAPIPIKILLVNFNSKDEYGWKKGKNLAPCFLNEHMTNIKKILGDKLVICNSESQFKNELKKIDLFLMRGREICVLKSLAKSNIVLSFDRAYLSRLCKVLPYYDNLKIMLYSPVWLNRDIMGDYEIDNGSYCVIEKYRDRFIFGNVLGEYYRILKDIGKENVKKELGLPVDRKIAFFSFRMAHSNVSIHDNKNMFFAESVKMLKRFKDEGYFIVARRKIYKTIDNQVDISQHPDLRKCIDIEMNGHGGYPDLIWRVLFSSDVLISPDVTGLLFFEGLLTRCPVYMPYRKIPSVEQRIKKLPPVWEMIKSGLIMRDYNEQTMRHYYDSVESFIDTWHGGDVDDFWKSIIDNVITA